MVHTADNTFLGNNLLLSDLLFCHLRDSGNALDVSESKTRHDLDPGVNSRSVEVKDWSQSRFQSSQQSLKQSESLESSESFVPFEPFTHHALANTNKFVDLGIAASILIEDLSDYRYRITVYTQSHGFERLSLFEDKSVVANRMGNL